MSAASSVSSLSIESTSSGNKSNNIKMNGSKLSTNQYPLINPQLVQNVSIKNASPDFYIIRVTYETDNVELDGIVLYKSIMLGNNERTPQVIRNSMMKLGLEGDPDRYTLAQVLPDKELVMPPNANVYYAVNTAFNLNFILRPRKDDNNWYYSKSETYKLLLATVEKFVTAHFNNFIQFYKHDNLNFYNINTCH